jgi:hypothetical protein
MIPYDSLTNQFARTEATSLPQANRIIASLQDKIKSLEAKVEELRVRLGLWPH